jgi:hypothetical protein
VIGVDVVVGGLKWVLFFFGEGEGAETSVSSRQNVIPAKAGPAFLRRSRTSRAFSAIHPERHSREGGNPVTSNVLARKALDSRLRGNDEQKKDSKQQKRKT